MLITHLAFYWPPHSCKVVSGDLMKNSEGDLQKVVDTRKFRAHEKIEVETTLGLLTVNGVKTTSLCDNVEPIAMKKFPKGLNFEKVFIHLRDHTHSVPSLINNLVSERPLDLTIIDQ